MAKLHISIEIDEPAPQPSEFAPLLEGLLAQMKGSQWGGESLGDTVLAASDSIGQPGRQIEWEFRP